MGALRTWTGPRAARRLGWGFYCAVRQSVNCTEISCVTMWTGINRNNILLTMPETEPPAPPPRPPFSQRIRPWVELVSRLLAAIAAALAIWKGLS